MVNGSDPDWGRRIGIGLVPSLAWIAASCWAVRLVVRYSSKTRTGAGPWFLALAILVTDALCIIGLQFHGHTLWKVAYFVVPGAKAIRAVARYIVVLALPMAIAFSFAIDHAMRRIHTVKNGDKRFLAAAALLAVVSFGLIEQMADQSAQTYSISAENSRLARLSEKLPDDCSAFYVAASESSAKADFGEEDAMHDAMLISLMRHVPTLNGRSGKNPPGWSLRNTTTPDYARRVQKWIDDRQIHGKVCRLSLD